MFIKNFCARIGHNKVFFFIFGCPLENDFITKYIKMKKHLIVFGLLLFLGFLNAFAAPVRIEKARLVAKNLYFERANIDGKVEYQNIDIANEFLIERNGIVMYYIFNISDNRGWVAVSADDRTIPVMSYALTGTYGETNPPESFVFWMNKYENQIAYAIENNLQQPAESYDLWLFYSNPYFSPSKSTMAVSPLLGLIKWNQGCYYNAQCPTNVMGDCQRVPTGCVATAMGMIMKYHAYPTHGFSSNSYVHPTYGTQSADFGAATYGWASMPNTATGSNAELAEIMKHCGVSVNMDYNLNGSGAFLDDAVTAFKTYFIYEATYGMKDLYTDAAWDALLKSNLDLSRPILYGGIDVGGGHAFVCDGYQGSSNDYFHFNWGWDGDYNSYNYLDYLVPGDNLSMGNYTSYQDAVVNIYPHPATMPVAIFSANTTSIAVNNVISLTDMSQNSPVIWAWSVTPNTGVTYVVGTSSSSQNPKIRFSVAGTYSVSLVASNSAGSDTEIKNNYIQVSGGSGVEDGFSVNSFYVYPNPVSNILTIETGMAQTSDIDVLIMNVVGEAIPLSGKITGEAGKIMIDVSSLAHGLYYVSLKTENGLFTSKISVID